MCLAYLDLVAMGQYVLGEGEFESLGETSGALIATEARKVLRSTGMTFSFKAVVWNGVPVIKLSDFEPTQLVSKALPNCHVRCCTLIVTPALAYYHDLEGPSMPRHHAGNLNPELYL